MRVTRSTVLMICVLAAIGVAGGCGGEQDGVEATSSALLQNRPYIQGGAIYQTHGGTDAWGTVFNNKVFFTFVRTDSRIGVIVESNTGNNTGQNATAYALTDTSQGGASTIVFNNTLYLFYVGMNRHLYMKPSSDGYNWGATTELDSQPWWLFTPAAVVYNGSLVVFSVLYTDSSAGYGNVTMVRAAGNPLPSGFQSGLFASTNNTVSVTVWNNTVYVAWLYVAFHGTGLYVSRYLGEGAPNGLWWSGDGLQPDGTATLNGSGDTIGPIGRPALFPQGSQLELVYRGNDSHIYRSYTNDGLTFSAGIQDGASTTNQSAIPFLASGFSDAWVIYVGTNGELYTALE